MKRYLSLLLVFTLVTCSFMFFERKVNAFTATPESLTVDGNGNYNSTNSSFPFSLENDDTVATVVTLDHDVTFISVGCPSWGDNIGDLTVSLYTYDTDYEKTLTSSPIASNKFVGYSDNSYLGFSFEEDAPLPKGEYLMLISEPSDEGGTGVGVWQAPTFEKQKVYENGVYNSRMSLRMYVRTVSGVTVPTATPETVIEKQYLYDEGSTVSTGWWFNPYAADSYIRVTFTAFSDFNGFEFFHYAPKLRIPVTLTLLDEDENVIWTDEEYIVSFDAKETIQFDMIVSPGTYYLDFTARDADNFEGFYFVLGSGDADENTEDVTVETGGNVATNESTKANPYICLTCCDPDPNATLKPTKAPATPSPVPTPSPTKVSTDAPQKSTNQPQATKSTSVVTEDESKDSNITTIIIAAVSVAVIIGVVVTLILKRKK